jgi:WD40 repeat protein/serine/threonine protein kinase
VNPDVLRQLAATAPTPLARLAERAQNDCSPERQHHNSYYLFELWLRLLAAVAAVRYRSVGRRVDAVEHALRELVRPSVGSFVNFLNAETRASEADDLQGLWSQQLTDGMQQGYRWVLRQTSVAGRERPSVGAFAEALAAYRNKHIGHGAMHPPSFYRDGASALFGSIGALVSSATQALPGRLLAVEEVVEDDRGERSGVVFELTGNLKTRIPEPISSRNLDDLRRGHVYFEGSDGKALSLFPWLIWEDDFVLALNGATKTQLEYLNYYTGERRSHHSSYVAALRAVVDTSGHSLPETSDRRRRVGEWIGDYEVRSELGRGGMGTVYLAQQESTDMPVALKVLPDSFVRDEVAVARFRREVHLLKRCEHPHVISVLDAGEDGGRHFYAMEFVRGCSLAEVYSVFTRLPLPQRTRLTEGHLLAVMARIVEKRMAAPPPSARRDRNSAPDLDVSVTEADAGGAELWKALLPRFAEVADALAHLHGFGVIHRDIKPSNIMLTEDASRAVVMDLGVAKTETSSVHTRTGTFVGTLRYASREQVVRSLDDLTFRSDLYSLGAAMYELFTLTPLFGTEEATVSSLGDGALLKKILDERPPPALQRNPSLRPEIAIVLEKLLEKQPERRFYSSAADLAEDLRSIHQQRPIRAREYTATERRTYELFESLQAQAKVWEAERRPRDLLWSEERSSEIASLDVRSRFELTRVEVDFLDATAEHAADLRAAREERGIRERKVAQEIDERKAEAQRQRTLLRRLFVGTLLTGLGVTFAFTRHELIVSRSNEMQAHKAQALAEEVRNLAVTAEAQQLFDKARQSELTDRWGEALLYAARAAEHASDPEQLAHATAIFRREAAIPVRVDRRWSCRVGANVQATAFSPDGQLLAVAFEPPDNAPSGAQPSLAVSRYGSCQELMGGAHALGDGSGPRAPRARAVAFSPNGVWLAVAADDGTIELWGLSPVLHRQDTWRASDRIIRAVAFTQNSEQVAAGGDDGALHIRRVGSTGFGPEQSLVHVAGVSEINAMAADVTRPRLALARDESTITVLDERSWTMVTAPWRGDGWAEALTFGGDNLLWGGDDNLLHAWSATASPASPDTITDTHYDVYAVAASADGTLVASAGEANAVHLTDMQLRRDVRQLTSMPDEVMALGMSADGQTLAIGTEDGTLDVRDIQRVAPGGASPLLGHADGVEGLAFWRDRDGDYRLVSSGDDDTVRVWDLSTGHDHDYPRRGVHAALDAHGSIIAAAGTDGIALLGDSGAWLPLDVRVKDFVDISVSPDESKLAFVAKGGVVGLCSVMPRRPCVAWRGHRDVSSAVAFSPDGAWLASAGDDPGVVLWSVQERSNLALNDVSRLDDSKGIPLEGSVKTFDVSFSHHGTRIAGAARDGRVLVWDATTHKLIRALEGHGDRVYGVDFSPDDREIASASKDTTVRVWDTVTWNSKVLRGHISGVYVVRFSPDGKLLASGSEDRTIRLWDTDTWSEHGARESRYVDGLGSADARVHLLERVCRSTGLYLEKGVPEYARSPELCQQ